jgi:hypothetical protein
MCHEIIPQHQNSFKIDSGRNRGKEAKLITLNFRIIDGHIELPYCMLFFDKSNKRSINLETTVT